MNIEVNIQNKKLELIRWLSSVEDSTIIEKIFSLIKQENKDDWRNSISEDEKKSIEIGLKDVDEGRTKPHLAAEKLYGKWL